MRRLGLALLGFWIARWALRELAAQIALRMPVGPAPIESPRRPGYMPGPFDRV